MFEKLESRELNKSQYEQIKKKLQYKYPDILLSAIPTKASVSKLKEKVQEENYFGSQEKIIVDIEEIMPNSRLRK